MSELNPISMGKMTDREIDEVVVSAQKIVDFQYCNHEKKIERLLCKLAEIAAEIAKRLPPVMP